MSASYYYTDNNTVYGPVGVEAMRVLIEQKVLNKDSSVCVEGSQNWNPLGSVPELAMLLPAKQTAAASVASPVRHAQPQPQPKAAPAASSPAAAQYMPAVSPQVSVPPSAAFMNVVGWADMPAVSPQVSVPPSAAFMNVVGWAVLVVDIVFTLVMLFNFEGYDFRVRLAAVLIAILPFFCGGLLTAFLFFALRDILTWLYNIMLDTKRNRR